MTGHNLRDLIELRIALVMAGESSIACVGYDPRTVLRSFVRRRIEDATTDIITAIREAGWLLPSEVRDAVLAEREECVTVLDRLTDEVPSNPEDQHYDWQHGWQDALMQGVAVIRARPQP